MSTPVGARVVTRDGARGTVVGPDGVDHGALKVRLDHPWSESSVDGHLVVSPEDVTVLPADEPPAPDPMASPETARETRDRHNPPPIIRLPAPGDTP